jgi:hypothetical protein
MRTGRGKVRKFGAWLLATAIGLGGMILMALAGLVALLITDPIYPFWPVFLPLAILVTAATAWMMGRIPRWLFHDHPERRFWEHLGWGVAILGMATWGFGVYHFCTMPIHWQ